MSDNQLRIASAAHQGKKRKEQQDRVAHREDFGVVCDGMGGCGAAHAGGVAAETALNGILASIESQRPTNIADARQWMSTTIQAANVAVFEAAQSDVDLQGMGSTVLIALRIDDMMLLGWLGDSRAYRLRGGQVAQLTKDHTLAQAMVDAGRMTVEEAEASRFRHILHRCVGGTNRDDSGELLVTDVQPGDKFLLCSDGIDKEMTPDTIGQLLACSDEPGEVCQALIDAALANEGRDNIATVAMFTADQDWLDFTQSDGVSSLSDTQEMPVLVIPGPWYAPFLRAVSWFLNLGRSKN